MASECAVSDCMLATISDLEHPVDIKQKLVKDRRHLLILFLIFSSYDR